MNTGVGWGLALRTIACSPTTFSTCRFFSTLLNAADHGIRTPSFLIAGSIGLTEGARGPSWPPLPWSAAKFATPRPRHRCRIPRYLRPICRCCSQCLEPHRSKRHRPRLSLTQIGPTVVFLHAATGVWRSDTASVAVGSGVKIAIRLRKTDCQVIIPQQGMSPNFQQG